MDIFTPRLAVLQFDTRLTSYACSYSRFSLHPSLYKLIFNHYCVFALPILSSLLLLFCLEKTLQYFF